MSEQQQGPGWWQASDGRWYPPEQAPSAAPTSDWATPSAWDPFAQQSWGGPPPTPVPPPKSGMSTGRKVALTVGAIVGVLAVLATVVALLGTSSDDTDAAPASEPVEVPASFVPFEDPEGEFALSVDPGWINLSLRGDVTGLGAATAPDNPARAAAIDGAVAAAPRQVVFGSLDTDRLETGLFVPNIILMPLPRDGATIEEIQAEILLSVEAFGASDAHVERVQTSEGDGLRMTYRFSEGGPLAHVEGIQYYVLDADTVWVLTMTSDDMATDRPAFHASATSLVLR